MNITPEPLIGLSQSKGHPGLSISKCPSKINLNIGMSFVGIGDLRARGDISLESLRPNPTQSFGILA